MFLGLLFLSLRLHILTVALGQQTLHTLIGYKSNKLFAKFQIFLFVTKEKYQQILV